jgi:fumarylacetoacetase
MKTWKNIDPYTDFSIHNLPWGVFSDKGGSKRIGVALGNEVMDLAEMDRLDIFSNLHIPSSIWYRDTLNDFISLGKKVTSSVRTQIQKELTNDKSILKSTHDVFIPIDEVEMHMPVFVRDYTDFYSSIEHATNVGKMFRDPENALLPNWKHLPVGYHGRASSIVVSGTDIKRPYGQTKLMDGPPVYGPSQRLDFELEMAFIVGKSSDLGQPIPIGEAEDYIFGMVMFNDWSARDIQKWEYVPLGPFLGKSFASSVSPWVVPMEALDPFRIPGPKKDTSVLSYLDYKGNYNFDIHLEVDILSENGTATTVCRSNFKYMYWNMLQQLTHHTSNGCNVNVGDMMASGTISGKDEQSYGSMLELSWAGSKPVKLKDGTTRKFLNDGDTVVMRGFSSKDNIRVGFGEVSGKIISNN